MKILSTKKNSILHCLLILAAGTLWGMMGLFVRGYNERSLDTFYIVAIRAFATSIIMFFYLLVTDRNLLKIKLKDLWCFIGTGLFSIIFFNFCYFKTIVITSLSLAAVLLYTAPVFVMIISRILFKEAITRKKIISIALTLIGCILVTNVFGVQITSVKGIIIGLGSGIGYALYSIFSRYAISRGYHSLTITFYTFFIAAICVIPFININNLLMSCFIQHNSDTFSVDYSMILFTIVFATVSTVIPYILYTAGLKKVENSTASIIASVEPVVATLIGFAIYHESMSLPELAGVVLVIMGIVFSA